MEQSSYNILNGDIKKSLLNLAIPIILSNFIQTMLGIIDMIWVGRLGSGAVSAIGTAGFYINLASAFTTLIVVGTGIKIAHSIGSNDMALVRNYIKNGLILSIIVSFIFVLFVFLFSDSLIAYFGMNDLLIETMAINYLRTSLIGVPLLFLIAYFTTVYTSFGQTKITFRANSIGLLLNILIDPIFIFGFKMGVIGAAWATNIARVVIVVLLVINANEDMKASIRMKFDLIKIKEVLRLSLPVTIQRLVFIYISMIMAKIIVRFGTDAIAIQKIGIQIESITFVTIGGLQGAISTFIGQNYGRKNLDRVRDGYAVAIKMASVFGIIISLILIVFPRQIYGIFINEANVIGGGVLYMQAIGFSQVFACIELLTVGSFNGIGRSYIPPLVSISLTLMRIPIALYLSSIIGISGIWWSISISSILKGIVLFIWFNRTLEKELSYGT